MLPQDQGEPRLGLSALGQGNRVTPSQAGVTPGRSFVPACDEMGTMAGKTGQGETRRPSSLAHSRCLKSTMSVNESSGCRRQLEPPASVYTAVKWV